MKELNIKQAQSVSGATQYLQLTLRCNITGIPDSFVEQFFQANNENMVGKTCDAVIDDLIGSYISSDLPISSSGLRFSWVPVERNIINI